MPCAGEINPAGIEFFEKFNAKVVQNRVPIVGGIELSHHCNLNCIHCYLGRKVRNVPSQGKIPASRWMRIIDQITDAGCLYLLFTGGETLLYPDFRDIYRHARQNGLLTTVFTNATLVTDKIIETFQDAPPHFIEATIYGATPETYEKVTGVKGAYEKCMKGIYRIKELGLALKLKTVLLRTNIHEIDAMVQLADEIGVSFRYDAMVFPRFNGDLTPIRYRVDPKSFVAYEFSDAKRAADWRDIYLRTINQGGTPDLYQCGAGLTMFHIDPSAIMRPCLMTQQPGYDLRTRTFSDIWEDDAFVAFRKNREASKTCRACEKKVLCGYCPPFFRLESGKETDSSSYLCEIGQERESFILKMGMREPRV